jgi:hypothetical protein
MAVAAVADVKKAEEAEEKAAEAENEAAVEEATQLMRATTATTEATEAAVAATTTAVAATEAEVAATTATKNATTAAARAATLNHQENGYDIIDFSGTSMRAMHLRDIRNFQCLLSEKSKGFKIDLRDNDLDNTWQYNCVDSLVSFLQMNECVAEIRLGGNRLSHQDTARLLNLAGSRKDAFILGEQRDPSPHVHLVIKDLNNSEVHFKCKKTTRFQQLMDAFYSRTGRDAELTRFLHDGLRIDRNMTLADLEMENDDVIDAMEAH